MSGRRKFGWGWLVLGVVIFGVLMGIREVFHSIWLRAAVAGCAAVFLLVALSRFRRLKA